MLRDINDVILNFDEPFADSSALPSYLLAKNTSKYFKVALTGDGGDEIFGGYTKYQRIMANYFQNNNFLVINKWSDIATQGGSKVNVSIDHIIKNVNPNYRLVHRLDKETSGLLLISKNLKYARYFSTLFKQHLITKFYIALCEWIPKNKNSKVNLNIKNKNHEIERT